MFQSPNADQVSLSNNSRFHVRMEGQIPGKGRLDPEAVGQYTAGIKSRIQGNDHPLLEPTWLTGLKCESTVARYDDIQHLMIQRGPGGKGPYSL